MAEDTVPHHPDYDAWSPSWKIMRDAADGTEAIKEAGEEYLPRPSGMAGAPDPSAAYTAYLKRAVYPELVSPTIRGMTGIMYAKAAQYELPSSLEHMRERATRDGMALDGLQRRLTREVLIAGRYGLLADMPSTGTGQPYLAGYTAESIVNWDLDEDRNLVFLVLDESEWRRDSQSGAWSWVQRFRTLELIEGRYSARIDEYGASGILRGEAMEPTRRGGAEALDFIPFVFVDTNDLTPEPDEIPLLPLARLSAAIYRADADYRHSLYLTSQPTPVVIGAGEEKPTTIGSATLWMLPEGGNAKFLEFTGAGISAQRTAIRDDLESAVQLGARLLAEQTGAEESGEARRLRYANETATLTSIAQNTASGLERALRYAAVWAGADPEQVIVTPDTDFLDRTLTPQEVDALVRGWMSAAYSYETLFGNLKRGGIIADDRTVEEERDAIDAQAPSLTGEPLDLA